MQLYPSTEKCYRENNTGTKAERLSQIDKITIIGGGSATAANSKQSGNTGNKIGNGQLKT